jgi:hypothetical protein
MHTGKLLHLITGKVRRKQAIVVTFPAEHPTSGTRLMGPAASCYCQHMEAHDILEGKGCSLEKIYKQLYKQDA